MNPSPMAANDSCVDDGDRFAADQDLILVCGGSASSLQHGRWHFALETADGEALLEADDIDAGDLNRLNLLAAVRGLESIDGPATVTLLSHSRYLIRSLSDSLPRWRAGNFTWEHFGRKIEVQHADLWRRMDRAVAIHAVEACLIQSRRIRAPNHSFARDESRGGSRGGSRRTWRTDDAHAGVPTPRGGRAMAGDRLRQFLVSAGG